MHLFSGALQRVGHTNFTNNGDTLLRSYEFIIISFTSLSFNFLFVKIFCLNHSSLEPTGTKDLS
ncbi:hypothetical protein BTM469_07350 [Helicobacter pylori]